MDSKKIFLNEKRAFAVLIFILAYYVFVKLVDFDKEYLSIITCLFWSLLSVYVYFQKNVRPSSKLKHKEFFMIWMLVCGVLYIVSYFAIGIIDGFGSNMYDTSFVGVLKNILTLGTVIIFREWVRNYIINSVQKKYAIFFGALIIIIFSFSEINIQSLVELNGIEEWMSYVSANVLPQVFFHTFLTFAAYTMGYIGTMIYASITRFPIWIVNVVPNFRWITILLVGTLFPILCIVILLAVSKKKATLGRKRIQKKENPYAWLAVSVLLVGLSWFSLGIFPVFPSVIVSNSMNPIIEKGDLIFIDRISFDDLEIGDIIQYQLEDIQVVHRIVRLESDEGIKYLITKGDNNNAEDVNPVGQEQVKGKYIGKIPYIGWPSVLLTLNANEDRVEQGE